ncbi:hypothetical protein [Mangrovibacter yixingensis]|uniref:hypothetical protein n=1 Tax=Mangrovibacter yixingensis TaxID=1529639 RepID=UPI001CFF0898|nr:hypothetical protein [Mangrovibacter yixingensis]
MRSKPEKRNPVTCSTDNGIKEKDNKDYPWVNVVFTLLLWLADLAGRCPRNP